MRKRLQIALMASTLAATSLSLTPQLRGADGDGPSEKITATDEHGRKIYVNDSAATSTARHTQEAQTPGRTLMYWSSKDIAGSPCRTELPRPCERHDRGRPSEPVRRQRIEPVGECKIVAANFSNT